MDGHDEARFQGLVKAQIETAEALQKMKEEAQMERQRRIAEETINNYITIGSAMYDKGAAYTALIMSVGYVGLFTIWNNTKSILPGKINILVACLITVSVMVFVFNEILMMRLRILESRELTKLIEKGPENVNESLKRYNINAGKRKILLESSYPIIFWATTIGGVGAGIILLAWNLMAMLR